MILGEWVFLMSEVPLPAEAVAGHRRPRFHEKREQLNRVDGHLPESEGHNLALTVLHVPSSLDSGCYCEVHGVVQGYLAHKDPTPPLGPPQVPRHSPTVGSQAKSYCRVLGMVLL